MNDIYNVVFPFLWPRVEHFEKCLDGGLTEEANRFLDETWDLLVTPRF